MSYENNKKIKLLFNIRIWQILLILPFLLSCIAIFLISSPSFAAFGDTPTDWDNFSSPPTDHFGYKTPYTYLGQTIADHTTSSDPTNGGTGVQPDTLDLSSGSPNSNPGSYDTPTYGYYDGGTTYDPLAPSTLENDFLLFRLRVTADPRHSVAFDSNHWNILVDVDDDGYKEFWVDLEGGYKSNSNPDRVRILYNNDNSQLVGTGDQGNEDLVEQFEAYHDAETNTSSFTRSFEATTDGLPDGTPDGTGDWWIEIQVPMTAFIDENGNQALFPDSPVGFVFSTSASNTDPLQKDFMMDLDFITSADPITFGDIVTINGEPRLEFVDSSLEKVNFYTVGDDIYTYVKHPLGNTDPDSVEYITVTVTNPRNNDNEQLVKLYESGPNSGLFTNRGGAQITDVPDPDNGWISSINTSTATQGADWTLTYQSSGGTWLLYDVTNSTSHAPVTAGTEYTSDNDEVTFTLYDIAPADGDTITVTTYPAFSPDDLQQLTTTQDDLITSPTDDDNSLVVDSGDTIQFSYIYGSVTYTTETFIVGDGEPFVQFTRASGLPSTNFQLTDSSSTSDKLYVTVIHDPSLSEYDLSSVDTIQVTLSDTDGITLTLTETGAGTGIFRNTIGLDTQVSDGSIDTTDSLWEDIDGGEVTARYEYPSSSGEFYSTSATLFYINGAGRVSFTNSAGTQDVELYGSGDEVYIKVEDANAAGSGTLIVTLANLAGDGGSNDSQLITVYETATDSGVFMSSSGITTATSDGSYSSTSDNVLEAVHNTTITVTYTDGDDGDTEPSNNNKTDTATYNAPPIVINEVFFFPDTGQTEYFQIFNPAPIDSGIDIDIFEYTVTDGDAFTYVFPDNPNGLTTDHFWLQPGEYAYVFLYGYDASDLDQYDSGVYYLFTDGGGYPSDQFGDPDYASEDQADQLTLYDGDVATGVVLDYIGWSNVGSPSVDFKGDDSPAVAQGIWGDDYFFDVSSNPTQILKGYAISRITDGVDTDVPEDWEYQSTSSLWSGPVLTPVVISSFEAFDNYGRVLLRWETAYENGSVGFYIYRKAKGQFMYELVNKKIVPALITNPQGGTYRLYDKGAVPGKTYSYLLEEIVTTGERIKYGPFEVNAVDGISGSSFFNDFSRNPRNDSHASQKRSETRSRIKRNKIQASGSQLLSYQGKPSSSPGSRPDALQISILSTGLYYISAEEISEHFNLKPGNISRCIKTHKLDLENQGWSVPYFSDEQNSGIYFYGLAYNDIFTQENIYWLTLQSGQEMEKETLQSTHRYIPDQNFAEIVHVEEDYWPALAQPWDNTEDYWIWDYAFSGFPELSQLTFNFNIEGAANISQNAFLSISFVGGSIEGGGEDHLAEVSLNDSWIGNCSWEGIELFSCELSFQQFRLNEGENVLKINGILIGDAGFSLFYVDSFDVQYQRYYDAVENSLHFQGDENRAVSISGFDGSMIYLLNVSNPNEPKLLKNRDRTKNNPSSWLSFNPENSAAQYFAVSQSAIKQVDGIRPYNFTGLKKWRNLGQYLVITPAELGEAAQELADYRSRQGFKTKVVFLEDIVAEFNHGIYSPYAVKEFLAYAYHEWQVAPEYVVLIGDATYDYRDLMGYGGNLLPTIFVTTPHGLFASDNHLADVDDNGVPDMAIGRLPVLSEEEFMNIFHKIKDYEYKSGGWKNKVILLADKADEEANFTFDSDRISRLIPSDYSLEKIYLSDYSLDYARHKLFDELKDGSAFVNFFGHAGIDHITQQGLLHSDDISGLSTIGNTPVVTAMTCAIGQFTFPFLDTLAEVMVLQPNGGATAVWSSSSLSENSEARLLDSFFYSALNSGPEALLGDLIINAFQEYSVKGEKPYHILIYNLLGDPALIVR